MERQIISGCGNCWFCYNGQCNYHGKCYYTKKWSNVLQNFVPTTYIEPTTDLQDFLTLTNELESENKELKRYKLDWLNSEKMHLQADMEDTEFELFCANNSLEKVRAENKKLKDRISELEKEIEENAFYSKGYAQGVKNTYEVVVPDKLK